MTRCLIAVVITGAVGGVAAQSREAEEKRLRVINTDIPLYAERIQLFARPNGAELAASIFNRGTETLHDVYLSVTIMRENLPLITRELRIDVPLQPGLSQLVTARFDTKLEEVDSIRFECRGFKTQTQLDAIRAEQAKTEMAVGRKRLADKRAADARQNAQIAAAELKAAQQRNREEQEKRFRIEQARRNCQETRNRISSKQIGSLTVAEKDMYDACRAAGLW